MAEELFGLVRYDLYRACRAQLKESVGACDLIVEWLEDKVIASHPLSAYPHVCPGLPESIRRKALWIGHADFEQSFDIALSQLVAWERRFWLLDPITSDDSAFKAIILALHPGANREFIQRLKNAAKLDFVKKGLMVGTFNPQERGSRYDPEIDWPPRSPVPIFSIRQMIRSDLRFLAGDSLTLAQYNVRFPRTR